MTPGQTAAQFSLGELEKRALQFPIEEQMEIDSLRTIMRELIAKYGSSAEYAIMCQGFEIAILRGQ